MPPDKLLPIGLAAAGVLVLVGGIALFFLGSHHTIAVGSVAIGGILAVAGAALVLSSRPSGISKRLSRPRNLRSNRWTSNSRLQTAIAALIIGGATVGSYLYVSSQVSTQSGTYLGPTLSVD